MQQESVERDMAGRLNDSFPVAFCEAVLAEFLIFMLFLLDIVFHFERFLTVIKRTVFVPMPVFLRLIFEFYLVFHYSKIKLQCIENVNVPLIFA
jgi:hypothetical protein